ncbi:ribosomal protein L4 domain-containing protein [Massariosphaeria phaeospora]|uniref:Large ribosomal subunit protein uL4m n=1 Tax=Massariosphaeria phaeospora TaxID=100035 RepID=A0A7C8I5G6_9PLEO|nr:ribosomal protein L4 domain-containing protein [Massariosphaeria phaeospora]
MASSKMSCPMRGATYQLGRLSIRQDAIPKSLTRSISTSTSSHAAVSTTSTSADGYRPVKPFDQQTVTATIHHFPSFEPIRFATYPANHLYLPTRRDILHRAVIYEGDSERSGTASTKTRYEVRGSARKVRPQKGSGRARLGDKNSPMLRGGGVAFGPKPRDFATGLQKKVYDLAWRTALSYRFRKGELVIVDNAMEIESPSSELLRHIFDASRFGEKSGRSLLVTVEDRPLLGRALQKMGQDRQLRTWDNVDVKNLLELSRIVIERAALHNILMSHQDDLTHPAYLGPRPQRSPTALESVMGWPEFRALSLASASEREAIRSEAYTSVANSRWSHAETLPDGPEKLKLTTSGYDLFIEAKELSRARLPSTGPLEYQLKLNERRQDDAARTDRTKLADIEIEQLELQSQIDDIRRQDAVLQAEVAENSVEALMFRGEKDEADGLYETARDLRTEVAKAEVVLYKRLRDVALKREELLMEQGRWSEAGEQQLKAQEYQELVDQAEVEEVEEGEYEEEGGYSPEDFDGKAPVREELVVEEPKGKKEERK